MFNNTVLVIYILIGFAVWLGLVSVLLIRTISHYNRITKGRTGSGLTDILEAIVKELNSIKGRTGEVERVVATLTHEGLSHYQRIGIVRFNPFADTGGAQSFTIAILDQNQNGIVMTSLYARAGNRWYVKEIMEGKAKDLELSKEEQSAIEKAKQNVVNV